MFTARRVSYALISLVLVALLTIPAPESSDDQHTLTVRSVAPSGARGLHDVLKRLGFPVQQRLLPMREVMAPAGVYLLLDPPILLTTAEVSRLLETVRAGASLLVLPTSAGPLGDSLGVAREIVTVVEEPSGSDLGRIVDVNSSVLERRPRRFVLRRHAHDEDSTRAFRPPAGAITFDSVRTRLGSEPTLVGYPLGRGRVVVAAEPDLFANFVLREGDTAVEVVRIMEWLQAGEPARPLVFDEYHHGFGTHVNTRVVAARALTGTGGGRTVIQLAAAGLLLLLAAGVRPIKPKPRASIERRSALEHVGALARAYATVNADARATRLLVRGLRRRHGGLRGPRDEVAYVKAIAESHPAILPDTQVLSSAMNPEESPPPDAAVTAAIQRIERAIIS